MPPKRFKTLGPSALALLLASCVSLEDTHMPKGAVLKDQRTVLAVYASPSPAFIQEDNKAETVAKLTPGLAFIMQSAQNDKEVAASKELLQYLPLWDPAQELRAALSKELPKSGHPGKFIAPEDGGIAADDLLRLNKAADLVDWRLRYYIQNPDHPVPRNYSTFLQLDDALVFEVNLSYGVVLDDQQSAAPQLTAMTKLFRANTMRLLWKHENVVDDKGSQKLLYEFKQTGQLLINAYRKMLPPLAQGIIADYNKELTATGMYVGPAAAVSTSAAPGGLPSGWVMPSASTASTYGLPSGWTPPPAPAAAPGGGAPH